MISYVKGFFSTPSWWMPASCAKALRPVMALFGCTGTPVISLSVWLAAKICSLAMPVS
jgi:hypothetical protein